ATDLYTLISMRAVDVLRIDATAIGGIGAAKNLGNEATRRGLRVSYHEHPEVHEHCAFGFGMVDHIEMFPTDRQFDQAHRLTLTNSFQRVSNGFLAPSSHPGTGVQLNIPAVKQF